MFAAKRGHLPVVMHLIELGEDFDQISLVTSSFRNKNLILEWFRMVNWL